MSKKRGHKIPARPVLPTPPPRSSHRWLWVVVLAIAAAVGAFLLRRGQVPEPPLIATTGFEPVIASQLEQALAGLRANPRSAAAWGTLGMTLQAHDFTAEARFCYG